MQGDQSSAEQERRADTDKTVGRSWEKDRMGKWWGGEGHAKGRSHCVMSHTTHAWHTVMPPPPFPILHRILLAASFTCCRSLATPLPLPCRSLAARPCRSLATTSLSSPLLSSPLLSSPPCTARLTTTLHRSPHRSPYRSPPRRQSSYRLDIRWSCVALSSIQA